MKLYDFHCRACGRDFEELVDAVTDARCPACASEDVEKQLSAFSVGGAHGDVGPSAGGGCDTGCCGGCGIG